MTLLPGTPMDRRIVLMLVLSLLLAGQLAAQDDAAGQAQDASERRDAAPNIYPTLAAALIEMGAPVVDLRTPEEIEQSGMIDGAANILHTELDELGALIGEDRDRAVILYCGSGRRASRAIEALRERGYGGLVNAGGYVDLVEAMEQN